MLDESAAVADCWEIKYELKRWFNTPPQIWLSRRDKIWSEKLKPLGREAFCEDISYLIRRRNKLNSMSTRKMEDIVIIKLNMFDTSMKNWIKGHVCGTEIII